MVCNPNIITPAENRKWLYFVAISLALYIGGIVLILVIRGLINLFRSYRKKNSIDEEVEEDVTELEVGLYLELVEAAGILDSGQNLQGKVLVYF